RLAAVAVLLAAALVVGLALAFPPGGTPVSSSTTTTRAVTTTTSVPPTTAGPPTAAQALASLVGAVGSGVTAGTISPSLGQMITTNAQQMVTDVAAGKSAQATSVFQQTAPSIAHSIDSGAITPAENVVIQTSLLNLLTALGLNTPTPAPTQPAPTTPTTAAGPSGGPKGKGGKGN
ncbi:MAG: hypothetical protein ACRDWB_10115, partial [Acidimicrobiales bacterium]